MSQDDFRTWLAACAAAVVIILSVFAVQKNSNDSRATQAWERLADKYAPETKDEFCVSYSSITLIGVDGYSHVTRHK